jgi:hypothetical protein
MPQDHAKTLAAKCGCGEKVETDSDGDGVPYGNDECPQDSNKSVPRSCGGGEEAEADSDSDCFSDCIDERPQDCEKKAPGMCGCGVVDRDLGFDNDRGSRLPRLIPRLPCLASWRTTVDENALELFLPVQSPIETAKRRCQVCVVVE